MLNSYKIFDFLELFMALCNTPLNAIKYVKHSGILCYLAITLALANLINLLL